MPEPVTPARALPAIDKDSQAYWTGGERGELLIYRCARCRNYVHPPVPFCSHYALEGELPVNTGGGALSAGRLHAYGAVQEACTQLWGRAGARQVKGDPQICATSTAGGPLAGAMLLVRE